MKKNMLSVIILALLIVNIVLTSVMMFSVMGASRKTAKLVDGIALALDLELNNGESTEEGQTPDTMPMTDITVYNISDSMTIPLKDDESGKAHFCMVSVSLSLNNKHKDFETYGAGDLGPQEGLIKNEIINVFGSYTMADAKANQEQIKTAILEKIQALYGSDFIFGVAFSDIVYQ